MWILDNRTPYQAERTWTRDKDGIHHWIVVVKATYMIGSGGELTLSEKPVAPLYVPEYNGVDGESSLRYEADLTALKPATDVYLNAVAYTPKGKPRREVNVSFKLGRLYKKLRVYGKRIWRRKLTGGIRPSSPEPFTTMPITYEGAFGGFDRTNPNPKKQRIDFRNPVGTGVAVNASYVLAKPATNIEHTVGKWRKRWPAGFGAIASYWSPRRERAGTYDDAWVTRRKPLLPEDYDPTSLLCAPVDQQVAGYLQGGEPVELINLTSGGQLVFTLPKGAQRFQTYFGSTRKEHVSKLVSVIIESAGPRLILVWQTSLPCGNDMDYLDKTVIYSQAGNS